MAKKKGAGGGAEDGRPPLVQIRLLRREAPWDAGEEILLPRSRAERLISAGVAQEAGEEGTRVEVHADRTSDGRSWNGEAWVPEE